MIFRLVANFVRLLFLPLLFLRRRLAAPRGAYVSVEVDGRVVDIAAPARFWEWRAKKVLSLHALGELVDAVIADPRVKGLLVTMKSFRGGMASALSLRDLLARARAGGKDVTMHLPVGGDTKEVFVSTACSKVLLGPQAALAPIGFATSTPYVKAALDKAGLVPEVLAHGRFKSAGEPLVRDTMSDGQREQLGAIVSKFYDALVSGIAEGRGVTAEEAGRVVDGAPYIGREAVLAKLADGVAYDDEVAGLLGEAKVPARFVDPTRYVRARGATRFRSLSREATVGVVSVHGAIVQTGSPFMPTAGEAATMSAIRSARKNRRIRGVILHIDSPGGSALASDRIHHELEELAAEKPFVACMANVAASGGYYVAAPAHAIVAQPTTITGSIGVVTARFAAAPLLARLGIVTEVVKRGARADMLDPTRPLSDDERAAMQRELESIYGAFVAVVARGRKKSLDEIEQVAQGRVWTGADAKERGLVDALGGFDVALALLRARIGRGADRMRPVVVRAPRRELPPLAPHVERTADALAALASIAGAAGIDVAPLAFALGGERVLAWCPLAEAWR